MITSLVDGKPQESIPVTDRGLLYGDHLFETIAFVGEHAPLWGLHMARLVRDAARLLIPAPDPELLATECARLTDKQSRCVLRLALTRGSGGQAYQPPADPAPRRIILRRAWPQQLAAQRERGLKLQTSAVRLTASAHLGGIKHGNRLEQVLAAEYARRDGVDEAIMLDQHGHLTETIAGNLVVVIDGQALTPQIDGAGVEGVGLQALGKWLNQAPKRATLDVDCLRQADEIMVINSVAGIRPVRMLDGRALDIGPVCRRWQQLWDELFECDD